MKRDYEIKMLELASSLDLPLPKGYTKTGEHDYHRAGERDADEVVNLLTTAILMDLLDETMRTRRWVAFLGILFVVGIALAVLL